MKDAQGSQSALPAAGDRACAVQSTHRRRVARGLATRFEVAPASPLGTQFAPAARLESDPAPALVSPANERGSVSVRMGSKRRRSLGLRFLILVVPFGCAKVSGLEQLEFDRTSAGRAGALSTEHGGGTDVGGAANTATTGGVSGVVRRNEGGRDSGGRDSGGRDSGGLGNGGSDNGGSDNGGSDGGGRGSVAPGDGGSDYGGRDAGLGGFDGGSGALEPTPPAGAGAGGEAGHRPSGGDTVVAPPCPALFLNLSGEAFDQCLVYWTAKAHHLQTFTVSPDSQWFSGFFVPGYVRGEISRLATGATYREQLNNYGQLGLIPREINVSHVDSEARFTALWRPAESDDFVVVHDVPSVAFDTEWETRYWAHYTLTDWAVRTVPGLAGPLVTATWQKLAGPWGGVAAYHSRTSAELDAMDANVRRDGMVMTQLRAREEGGQTLYDAIWRPVAFPTRWVRSLSQEELVSMQETQKGDGYSLLHLRAIDASRFSAVWRLD